MGNNSECDHVDEIIMISIRHILYSFNAVGSLVSKKAKTITAEFDERHAAKTVSEMKHFVSKLPHLQQMRQSLSIHTSIAELIKEHTDSEEFLDSLRCQQEFINGLDTDKVNTYVEDCIGKWSLSIRF